MLRSHRGRTGWHGFRVLGLRTGLLMLLAGAQFEWFGLKSGAPAESKAVISDCIKTVSLSCPIGHVLLVLIDAEQMIVSGGHVFKL